MCALLLGLRLGLVGVGFGSGGLEEAAVLFALAGKLGEAFAGLCELAVGGGDAVSEFGLAVFVGGEARLRAFEFYG